MIISLKTKFLFKTAACAVVFSFLWHEIVWAVDLSTGALDITLEKLNTEQSQTFAPAYLLNQQAIHESMVDQKQFLDNNTTPLAVTDTQSQAEDAVEIELHGPQSASSGISGAGGASTIIEEGLLNTSDASYSSDDGAILSVTTAAGDAIHYKGGSIDSIERPDGTLLQNLTIDANNDLVAAEITYKDGTREIIAKGKTTTVIKPDGTCLNYNVDERITSITYPDNKTVDFSYVLDGQSGIVRTVLTDINKVSYYESDNKLESIVFNSGKKIEYESGVISKITESDTGIFTFTITTNADGSITTCLSLYTALNGTIYRYGVDESGSLVSITVEKDGVVAVYDKDGRLVAATRYGEEIIVESIVLAELEYDTALELYKHKKEETENYQADLDTARTALANITAAQDVSRADLFAAVRDLDYAQSLKDAKQTAYDVSCNDLIAAQSSYDAANAALNNARALEAQADLALMNAIQAGTLAEHALSDGNPYVVSSYAYSSGSITLNQYKNFINDQFDLYDSNCWSKPADSFVTIGSGVATLKGTGKNYNATFYSKETYSRAENPIYTTNFKSNSISGNFIAALDGYTAANAYRRVGIVMQNGRICVQKVAGSVTTNLATLVATAKANTSYSIEFQVTSQGIAIYLWESSGQKPASASYTYTGTNWAAVRPYYSIYSGTAEIDYAAMRGPDISSIYDQNSRLIKDTNINSNVSLYAYASNTITVSGYMRYLDPPYDLSTAGLWSKPADSLVTIGSGVATLKGTGKNYNATFYLNQSFSRSDNPVIRSDFKASSTSGNFIAALDGYTAANAYRRVGIVMQNGRICVQTVTGSATNNVATLVTAAKANTIYTVEFQVTSQGIAIYLWESSGLRPTKPSYVYAVSNWKTVRPYFSAYSAAATVSNMYINYIPQIRTISSDSPEYSKIAKCNQFVKDLNNAILNINIAGSAYNSALQDTQIKIAVVNATAADLAAKIVAKDENNISLQSSVQDYNNILAAKNSAQVAYDSAYVNYLSAQTVYTGALDIFNNAKISEEAAEAHADLLREQFDMLASASSLFTSQDQILLNAANKENIISVLYDAERRIQRVRTIGGAVQDYTGGLISSSISGSGCTLYSYDLSTLNNIHGIVIDRDGIKRIYDKYGNLTRLSLADATEITYENGAVREIVKADGTTIRNMTFNESGDLDGALISYPDGSIAIYHDAELLRLIGAAGTTEYADGKIRTVTLADGTAYAWSYENGYVLITDTIHQQKRKYSDGRLIELEEMSGSRLTTKYHYSNSGSLVKSEVCKNADILYTYNYTYEDNLTVVHDEDGNVQAYTKEKKLAYIIDSKGRKYSYTYVGKSEGYIEVYFPSQSKARYDASGAVIDITGADSSVIKNIVLGSDGLPKDFTYIKDSVTYRVEDGLIREVLSEDNTKTAYYDNGFISSITSALGIITDYQYYVKDSLDITGQAALLTGATDHLSLYEQDSITRIALSDTSFKFGTGVDGIKHVTGNETLPPGTYNFTSLAIDAGKTLTIAPGAVVNILGRAAINGAVFSGGAFSINAYDVNLASGASITGAVSIRCNTIHNSGIITGNASLTGAGSGRYGNAVDDNFATGVGNYVWGMSDAVSVSFPSCNIERALYRTSLGSYGLPAYASVYLCVNGSWTCIASYGGSGDSGVVNNTTGWSNVTGMMMTGQSLNGNCVSSAYQLWEMQAIIGTASIEYVNGDPGAVNTTAAKPTATVARLNNPSSGTFESSVMALDALTFDKISWSQETPEGTSIIFQTRTGDTATPDATWSDWSAPLTDPDGSEMLPGGAKYFQYRATLSTTDQAKTPVLNLGLHTPIKFDYNRAPAVGCELSDIDYVRVSGGGNANIYDKNTWQSIVVNPLFDAHLIDSILSKIPQYLLNDTQKEIYLRDSVIISELTAITAIDGTVTEYCQGQISKITRPDGTAITDITFDADNKTGDYIYYKDGFTYEVKDGAIDAVITATGERIQYYPYALIESKVAGSSRIEYDYGSQANVAFSTPAAFEGGAVSHASLFEENGASYLALSDTSFKFGTGIDGVKHVTGNETLPPGTYNFTSLEIDAGKTLTIAPGAVVNILGRADINGAVFSGGAFSINAYDVNLASGASITGAVSIRCNTIHNSGIITGNASLTGAGSGRYGNAVDDNFATGVSNYVWGMSDAVSVSFPSCNIERALYRTSLGSYGLPAYASVYLCVNGSWTCIASYGGSGDSGVVNNTTGWSNVTGMMMTGQSLNGNCVSSAYQLWEMQAIIGTASVEYVNGDPGAVNTTASKPTATITQVINPSSGTFESSVMALDALTFDKISWSQETPEGTGIIFQTRTGDTAIPDAAWSDWSAPLTDPDGSEMLPGGAKYFQYRATLSTTDTAKTPSIVLDAVHSILIEYTKISDDPLDAYVKVKSGGITKAYNKNGVNIADPTDTIDITGLGFDSTYLDALADNIPGYKLSDAQKIITIYDQGNDTPVEIVTAGQSITYFEDGLATKVVDKDGTVQVIYTYDSDKNVINVEFADARSKLTVSYNEAVAQIVTGREEALAKLEAAEADNLASIASQSASALTQVNSERQRLTLQMSLYDSSIYDLSAFTIALSELDSYQTRLMLQTQDAYENLTLQIMSARVRVEADASTAMQNLINNDYNKILGDIVQKESSPIIYQYYRKVLGRDPGESDLTYWMNKAKADLATITPSVITQYLQNIPEYTTRQTRKTNIINYLTTFFTRYLAVSVTEKETMLAAIGLNMSDAVTLKRSDIDAILSWLNSQSLHFGDSAIQSVVSMLKSSGINKSFEDIGETALAVDIVTGVITNDTTGDLLLSMYAMRKAAAVNGLDLSSQKISLYDLKHGLTQGGLITHIDSKHYVTVTAIEETSGTITYIDSTVGENGQAITISTAEFMETWKGYALSKESAPESTQELSVTQEKNIRGSGWWSDFWKGIVGFFRAIVAPIGALLLFTPLAPLGAVLLGINIIIQTISFVVRTGTLMDIAWAAVTAIGSAIGSAVLPGIYSAAGNIFHSIGAMIPVAIKNVFTSCLSIFNPISIAVKGISTGIGAIFNPMLGEAVTQFLSANVIKTGIELGSNFLFTNMGLDPSLSSIGSALFSGALSGMAAPGADAVNIVADALRHGTIAGVNSIGAAVNLDSNITRLAGMLSGALVGGALSINGREISYDEIIDSVSPDIERYCSSIGLAGIGNVLGIDPGISYLTGIGLSNSIQTLLTDRFNPETIWQGIRSGLSAGATSVGVVLSHGAGAIALGSEMFANAVEGIIGSDGLFARAFTVINRIAPAVFNAAGQFAANIFSGARTFAQLKIENGILNAANTALQSLFSTSTIDAVGAQGGLEDVLSQPAGQVTLSDGRVVYEMGLTDDASIFLDGAGEIVAVREGGITSAGSFIWTEDQGLGMTEGTIEGNLETGYTIRAAVDNYAVTNIEINDNDGGQIVRIDPERSAGSIGMVSVFNPIVSEYTFTIANALIYFAGSYMAQVNQNIVTSISQKISAISAGSLFNDSNKFLYALANGICSPSLDPNSPPQYINNLAQDINTQSSDAIALADIFPIALYAGMTPSSPLNGAIDALKWFMDSQTKYGIELLKAKVQVDIVKYFTEHPADWCRPIIGMGYSGGFIPLIEGVSELMYNVKTIVGLGGPNAYFKSDTLGIIARILQAVSEGLLGSAQGLLRTLWYDDSYIDGFLSAAQSLGDEIFPYLKEILQKYATLDSLPYSPPKTDLIVNVWGTQDIFHKIGVVDVRQNFLGKTTYNIEIVGASHTDYIRDISDNSIPYWNREVANFCAGVIANSDDKENLDMFLRRNEYVSMKNGVYVVRLPGYEAFQ